MEPAPTPGPPGPGIDVPDARGRTGLDQSGRCLRGNPDGMLLETAAVTERIYFYAASYTPASRTAEGGGLADDGEDIDVVELPFERALAMVDDGTTADAQTIMLLQWAALRGPFARRATRRRLRPSAPPQVRPAA